MKKNVGQIAYMLLILAVIGLGLWLFWLVNKTILYILLAILILLVMVTIHEFGHYLAGKALKFKINEFAIGFGPKLFSIKRKNGEIFSIRLFPLGGFCAFEGEAEIEEEANEKKEEPFSEYTVKKEDNLHGNFEKNSGIYGNSYGHEIQNDKTNPLVIKENPSDAKTDENESDLKRFNDQAPWKRIIVFMAGGVFNLLSAVVFSFIFILAVGYSQPKIIEVYPVLDNPGQYHNQLLNGDVMVAVGGKDIGLMDTYSDLLMDVDLGESVVVTVIRDGQKQDIVLVKQTIKVIDTDGQEVTFDGFGFRAESSFKRVGVLYALKYSVPFTAKMAWSILGAFGGLFTGRVALSELSGPVGTIDAIADVSAMNWRNIFLLLPLIAANLGLFNLFPIPALDGSKIVFATIEWIRKKPINRNVEAYIHLAGMVVLLLFVIIIDIISFVL